MAPELLAGLLADRIATRPGTVRVAIDGAPCTEPTAWAEALTEPLRTLGRPTVTVSSRLFWRDASVRLEHGREDVESFPDWLDHAALQREVLTAAVERGEYLPSLRDPVTDRSTRAVVRPLAAATVVVVAGQFLLGRGLGFDLVVHLTMSAGALARRTPADEAWTLPAYADYADRIRPAEVGGVADVVVKLDDPARPAVQGLG